MDTPASMHTVDLPIVLTAKDVQEILGVSKDTTYLIMHRKGFPLLRIGRVYRVYRESFLRWLEETGDPEGDAA